MFPNKESALRLITAILIETHEGWMETPQYLNMSIFNENNNLMGEKKNMIEFTEKHLHYPI